MNVLADVRTLRRADERGRALERPWPPLVRTVGAASALAWRWFVYGRGRIVLVTATAFFVVAFIDLVIESVRANGVGWDYQIYMDRAADFVAGRGFYLPRQLAGPYAVMNGDALYPPPSVLLFVPFLYLPPVLYWAIPLTITATVIVWHRPAIWTWPLMAFIPVANNYLFNEIDKGNPGLWILAALSLATVRPAIGPFVALKWGLAPFALFGFWRREWRFGAIVALLVSLLFLPMWFDYIRVVQDARGNTVGYMLFEWPMTMIPLIAWAGRTRWPTSVRPPATGAAGSTRVAAGRP